MKKYLFIGLLLFVPLITKADTVYTFMNGQGFDPSFSVEIPRYAFLKDGNGWDYKFNIATTLMEVLGLNTSTPQTITVSNGLSTPTPTLIGAAPTPTPTPTPTPLPTPTPVPTVAATCSVTMTETTTAHIEWTSQNLPSNAMGTFYVSTGSYSGFNIEFGGKGYMPGTLAQNGTLDLPNNSYGTLKLAFSDGTVCSTTEIWDSGQQSKTYTFK